MESLNQKKKGHYNTNPFNPGGRSLNSCIGCSHKTFCAFCEVRFMANEKIEVK